MQKRLDLIRRATWLPLPAPRGRTRCPAALRTPRARGGPRRALRSRTAQSLEARASSALIKSRPTHTPLAWRRRPHRARTKANALIESRCANRVGSGHKPSELDRPTLARRKGVPLHQACSPIRPKRRPAQEGQWNSLATVPSLVGSFQPGKYITWTDSPRRLHHSHRHCYLYRSIRRVWPWLFPPGPS